MRRALLLVPLVVAAGCGGSVTSSDRPAAGKQLSAEGISVTLPDGWMGRIVVGAAARPVLHAANYALPTNDSDSGQIAQETIGSAGMLYVNVRDEGAGQADASLPIALDAPDFEPPGPEHRCCFVTVATRAIEEAGHRYRITVVSGSDEPPSAELVERANDVLATLALEPYEAEPVAAAAGRVVDGYGVSVALPDGWDGRVERGLVRATDGSLELTIRENGGSDAPGFVTARPPVRLGPAEFVPVSGSTSVETGRTLTAGGRNFVLGVRSQDEPPNLVALEQANAVLASFRAEAGDFYPGSVEPATFASAPGWHTGSAGRAEVEPDGQLTMSWAATIPYRDAGLQFPPHDTLAALPPDGIVIVVMLQQYGDATGSAIPEIRLSDFAEGSFEGLGEEHAPRQLRVRPDDYDAGLWVMFGREHPTAEQLARAQAELDRLRLPDWPPWSA